MGLRDVVAQRRAERERPKTLAELRARKQAEQPEPRPKTLAELRASKKKQAPPPKPKTLAEIKAAKQFKRSARLDFRRAGVKYHNVQQLNGYWTVDVSNGDKTFTLHNRHGAWYHDVGHEGRMAEPVRVARALGVSLSQLEISQALSYRLDRELKDRGIPTREQLLRQHEEEAKASRRKKRTNNNGDNEE